MKPVDTILQVGAFYNAIGFSFLYTSVFGGEAERKTAFYLRDSNGNIVDVILKNAEVLR
jgi:hypothetical protein